MSSFFEFGKTTIKVPNKMIFVNKQGYDNLTNPITKGGSIASRFGIKSLNVQPTEGNKIEIIESAPREFKAKPKAPPKPRMKKSNNKKEAEALLSEMMNTKINKKMEMPEMPELPEPKKEKKVKKAKPELPEPKKEKKVKKAKPEPRDNIINEWNSDTIPILLYQQDPEVYNNIEKKVNQQNKKNQYIVLNQLGFYIEKYIDDLFKHYGENKKAVEIIIKGLETIAQYIGANDINGYGYDGLLKWFNASNRQKVYKLYNVDNYSVTITNKKVEENEDVISGDLQKLIYTSSIDKIKKALVDLNYKGRIQTNKIMLNMQLLQNLGVAKQKELIKLLE